MAQFSVRLLVAVLAFGLGLMAQSARRRVEQSLSSNPVIEAQRLPSENFVGTGMIDMFMENYRRESDGAYLRFGCYVRSSEAAALVLVRNANPEGVIQKTDVLDINGGKVGERVMSGGLTRATIPGMRAGEYSPLRHLPSPTQ